MAGTAARHRGPDLPACFTYGDTHEESALMAADAARTYVASLLKHGDEVPSPTVRDADGQTSWCSSRLTRAKIVTQATSRLASFRTSG